MANGFLDGFQEMMKVRTTGTAEAISSITANGFALQFKCNQNCDKIRELKHRLYKCIKIWLHQGKNEKRYLGYYY